MARFPQDQFDELPADLKRVGAHRSPAPRGRGWIYVGWGLAAAAVLTVAGLYGLSRLNPDFQLQLPDFGSPTARPTIDPLPTAEPVTDPDAVPDDLSLAISVFNATAEEGLHNRIGDAIQEAGWPNPVRARASADDVAETVVYYRAADYEGVARGIVALLGAGRVVLSDVYQGAPVTVVIGADLADGAAAE